jgi:hypothetical protein
LRWLRRCCTKCFPTSQPARNASYSSAEQCSLTNARGSGTARASMAAADTGPRLIGLSFLVRAS